MKRTLAGGHEPVTASDDHTEASPRSFGLTFAAVFAIYALWPLWRGQAPRLWAASVSAVFIVVAVLAPQALAPANRVWQWIGALLHRIVNPVVMAVLFYLAVTPFAWLVRWRNKAWAARFAIDRSASSYWITRTDPPGSMRQQF